MAMRQLDDQHITLMIRDNGIGIPEEVDVWKSGSLGMHLVKILVEDQLRGDVTLKRNGGTTIQISFQRTKKEDS